MVPNLAIIEELKKGKNVEILYIGSSDGIEKKLVEKFNIPYKGVYCGKFRRYFSLKNFVDPFKIPVGIVQAYRALKSFGADVVFSKGGFVSFPVVVAARFLKIPVIVHESDITPGLSNKLCFRFANKICLSFEDTKAYISKSFHKKIIFTGPPVRESILLGDKEKGYKFTSLNKFRPVILVIGGSQGSEQINELVRASLSELLKKYQIVHIVGRGNLDISTHENGYFQYEYLDEPLKDVYAICEMVVSRGGANSLAELALLKKKVMIIPISSPASRGEQVSNSTFFARKFGWSLIYGELTREDFIKNVKLAFDNQTNLSYKFVNGTKKIVNLILKTAK